MCKANPILKLLYVTPEKIKQSPQFQNLLAKLHERGNLARVVIDEAHCVSQWGHEFRPDYKVLYFNMYLIFSKGMSFWRETFPEVPIMALTATATDQVRADIISNLKLRNHLTFQQSFNRPNLMYITQSNVFTFVVMK
jgi:bloom syndrome protein